MGEPIHLLVAIETRQVLIFRSHDQDSARERITPHTSARSVSYVHNSQDHGARLSKPASSSYYEAIADGLEGADQILLFAAGEGGAKTMESLLAELQTNHLELAGKVAGSILIEGKHVSEELLLEKAKEFATSRQPSA